MIILKIFKVLNNNVVVVKNENDVEQIVMGSGIGFKKKIGDILDQEKIDKVFALSNPDIVSKFQELIVDIPMEHIELGEKIVTFAKSKIGRKLNDMIYISLVDHIYTAIERFKQGIVIKNFLLWDIQRFYKLEYEIGLDVLKMIEERFGVLLPDDEAGFIALHIVNASLDEREVQDVYQITQIMQEITQIVKYEFSFEFDEDSIYYYRFVTHLKFFAQRLISNNTYDGDHDEELTMLVKWKYKNSYNCVNKIGEFILNKYDYKLTDDEKVYLTIHIERVIYKG